VDLSSRNQKGVSRTRESYCRGICSCEEPPRSVILHKLQNVLCISLKRTHLKRDSFDRSHGSALDTVDSMILLKDLHVDQLPK